MEINPVTFSGKKIIIADPIIKLSSFLKLNDFFAFERIKEILDNVEAKFDNIFIDVMDKKYNLDQINQFKENNNIY